MGVPVMITFILKSGEMSKKSWVNLDSGFFIFVDSSMIIATFLVFKKRRILSLSVDIVSKLVTITLAALFITK